MATWRTEQHAQQVFAGFDFHELPEVRKAYPHFYHKTDKWGRPVYIELLGHIDVDQLLKVSSYSIGGGRSSSALWRCGPQAWPCALVAYPT